MTTMDKDNVGRSRQRPYRRAGRTITIAGVAAAASLAFILARPAGFSLPAGAQEPPLHNPKIRIEYREPRYEAIYRRVKERQVLEELDQFLSPLRLKQELTLLVDEGGGNCASPNSYYSPSEHAIHICYSFLDMLENGASVEVKRAPGEEFTLKTPGRMPGITRGEVIVGGTIGLILHETGHAVFDIQGIPRLGREEDAADQIAAYMMMQFGRSVALTTIKGTVNVWHHLSALTLQRGGISKEQEADVHSLSIQRVFNYLCIAYGADPAAFKDLADQFLAPARKANCADEYRQADLAFKKTFLPDVDPDLLKRVRAMKILRPEDNKW